MLNSVQHIVLHWNKVSAKTTMSRLAVRGLCALFSIVLYTNMVLAQQVIGGTLYINGSFINSKNISVNNHIVNNTAGLVSVLPGTTTSSVLLTGAANVNGHSIYGGGPISFYRLDMRGGRETRLKVDVKITNQLRIGYTGNTFTALDSGFTIENRTLTIDSVATYLGTANLIFAGGTVIYDNTNAASQTLLSRAAGVRYGTLNLSGTSTKSITTTGTDSAATFTQAGGSGQISFAGNFDVTGTGSFADIGAIIPAKKLRLTATATSCSVTSLNNSGAGTFENASAGTLTFTGAAANNGTISNTSTGTITFAGNITNTNTITTATGTLAFNGTGTQTNTGGTISVTAGGNASFAGDIYTYPGTLTFNTGSTVTYNGASQYIVAVAYHHLVTSGTGTKTAGSNLTIGGNFTNGNNIIMTMGTNTLAITGTRTNGGTMQFAGTNNGQLFSDGTVEYNGVNSITQTIAAGNYTNLLLTNGSGSGIADKLIDNGATVQTSGGLDINVGLRLTLGNSGSTLSVGTSGTGDLTVTGTLVNNGTINIGN